MKSFLRVMLMLLAIVCLTSAVLYAEEPKPTPTPTPNKPLQPVKPPMEPIKVWKLDITVQGSPVEFPDDLYIRNVGTAPVPKATKIHWVLPNRNRQGDYVFTEDLAAGSGKSLNGVLPGGSPAGEKCTYTVVK